MNQDGDANASQILERIRARASELKLPVRTNRLSIDKIEVTDEPHKLLSLFS